MEDTPKFTTASQFREQLLKDRSWRILVDEKVINFEEVIQYLVEFPTYLEQIRQLPKWIHEKTEEGQVREFIQFMLGFPEGDQYRENAVLSMFGIEDFRFADLGTVAEYSGVKTPELVTQVSYWLCLIVIDAGRTDGIYFWVQVKEAMKAVHQFSEAAKEFSNALGDLKLNCKDIAILSYVEDVIRRDHAYGTFLPYESYRYREVRKQIVGDNSRYIQQKLEQ